MASGSGAGARAAACPTRKERLDLRKQRYEGLRRAMWSARVRLDQDRKKKEEENKGGEGDGGHDVGGPVCLLVAQ